MESLIYVSTYDKCGCSIIQLLSIPDLVSQSQIYFHAVQNRLKDHWVSFIPGQIDRLIASRTANKDKKMKKYNLSLKMHKFNHRMANENKVKRQNTFIEKL